MSRASIRHAITRAVGGEETLELDVIRDRVHAGDRFLLCSDGLTRTVPEERLASLLGREDIGQAVDGVDQGDTGRRGSRQRDRARRRGPARRPDGGGVPRKG